MGNLKNFRNHCKFIPQHKEFHRYFLKLSYIFQLIIYFFPKEASSNCQRPGASIGHVYVHFFVVGGNRDIVMYSLQQ